MNYFIKIQLIAKMRREMQVYVHSHSNKIFKGYPRNKMINSQSVKLRLINFLFRRKVMFRSQNIFNHPMICQICDVMMSINT